MNNFDRIKSREHFNLVIGQIFERGIRIKYTCTINQHSNKQNNVLKVIEIIFDRCLVVSLTFLALIYPLIINFDERGRKISNISIFQKIYQNLNRNTNRGKR